MKTFLIIFLAVFFSSCNNHSDFYWEMMLRQTIHSDSITISYKDSKIDELRYRIAVIESQQPPAIIEPEREVKYFIIKDTEGKPHRFHCSVKVE